MRGQSLAAAVSALAGTLHDDDLLLVRQDHPDDLHAAGEVPAGLLPESGSPSSRPAAARLAGTLDIVVARRPGAAITRALFAMDDRERASLERDRRDATEYLHTVVHSLRRHGMPRLPGARRLGGSRFGAGWGAAGPGQVARPTKA